MTASSRTLEDQAEPVAECRLRYAYTLPIESNGSYSTATLDDIWGISGNKPGCDPSHPTRKPATCSWRTRPRMARSRRTRRSARACTRTTLTATTGAVGRVNWTPNVESGFLHKLLGKQGDTSFSGGWARSYERRDMSTFTGQLTRTPA
jgi:hypothetical protein